MISTPNFFLKVNNFCFCVVSLLFLLYFHFLFAVICPHMFSSETTFNKLWPLSSTYFFIFNTFPSFDVKSIFFSFSVKCSLYVHQCCTFCVAIQKFFFSILNHSGTITNHHNCITIYTTTLDKTCWDKNWKFSKFKKWLNFSNSKFSPLPANINVESGQVLSSKA